MRILKTVKEFGSQTIGTDQITLDTQQFKALGDIVSWHLQTTITSTKGTGTYAADTTAWQGSNTTKLFKQISIKDANNTDIIVAEKADLYLMSYVMSLINVDEFILKRGYSIKPSTIAADQVSVVEQFLVAHPIAVSDLPATIEIKLGTLADYYATVGTATLVLNTFTMIVRYIPPEASAITIRVKAFNVSAFAANQDIATLLPENITIHVLGYLSGNVNAATAPAEIDASRVDSISFRRGANEEIETIRRAMIDNYISQRYETRPTGFTVIPSDAFKKTASTLFQFNINAQIAPRVYYVYQ